MKTQWLTNGIRIYYVASSMVSFMADAIAAAAAATIGITRNTRIVFEIQLGWIAHLVPPPRNIESRKHFINLPLTSFN